VCVCARAHARACVRACVHTHTHTHILLLKNKSMQILNMVLDIMQQEVLERTKSPTFIT
jgi:hypothetical protein